MLVRRLVRLLRNSGQLAEIDQLAWALRDQGAALEEITIVQALDAIRAGDPEQGIALAQQVFSPASTYGPDHLMLGRVYTFAGRTDEAGREFRRAVELAPAAGQAWLTHIQYLVRSNRREDAKRALDEARLALPADQSRLTLAECALMVGELEQAQSLLQTAQKASPHNPTALRVAADLCFAQRRLDQADKYLKELEQATGVSPGDRAWANRARASLLLATGRAADRQRALAMIEQNLTNDPGSSEDLEKKVAILAQSRTGRAQAIKILEQLAKAKRLDANSRFLLAQLYFGARDEQQYQREMRTLLSAKSMHPQHLAHFTGFLVAHNQPDEATRWLDELKKIAPHSLAALELEARLLVLQKREPEARALLVARGHEIPQELGVVADLLAEVGLATEAEKAYRVFISRDPSRPERLLALARFLARQDRPAEAMETLTKAWSIGDSRTGCIRGARGLRCPVGAAERSPSGRGLDYRGAQAAAGCRAASRQARRAVDQGRPI